MKRNVKNLMFIVYFGETIEQVERKLLLETYRRLGKIKTDTAQVLGISLRKVRYKIRQYGEEV